MAALSELAGADQDSRQYTRNSSAAAEAGTASRHSQLARVIRVIRVIRFSGSSRESPGICGARLRPVLAAGNPFSLARSVRAVCKDRAYTQSNPPRVTDGRPRVTRRSAHALQNAAGVPVLQVLAGPAGGEQFLVRAGGRTARILCGARNIAGLADRLVCLAPEVSALPGSRLPARRRAPGTCAPSTLRCARCSCIRLK